MGEIIEGKLYRVRKGDVIILPFNIEHGAYIREVDCKAIDISVPPRPDHGEKLRQAVKDSVNRRKLRVDRDGIATGRDEPLQPAAHRIHDAHLVDIGR